MKGSYDKMIGPRKRIILALVAMAAALGASACGRGGPAGASGSASSSGTAMVGGPFTLVDQGGKTVDQHLLDGKWSAVFFGYTYCPDVCPTTLQVLAQAKAKLGDKARDLQVVFISIDPDRDTPAQLKTYLSTPSFPQPTIGLTGSADQVAVAAREYRVYYAKEGTGPAYAMSHSSLIYLMNPKGKFDSILSDAQTPDKVAAQIGDAIKAGAKG